MTVKLTRFYSFTFCVKALVEDHRISISKKNVQTFARFSFVDKDIYLHKSFEEDALDPNVGTKLGKHYLSLDLCGLSKATKIF